MNVEYWVLKKEEEEEKKISSAYCSCQCSSHLKLWGNQITSETRRNFHLSTIYFPLALRFATVGKSTEEPSLSCILSSYVHLGQTWSSERINTHRGGNCKVILTDISLNNS